MNAYKMKNLSLFDASASASQREESEKLDNIQSSFTTRRMDTESSHRAASSRWQPQRASSRGWQAEVDDFELFKQQAYCSSSGSLGKKHPSVAHELHEHEHVHEHEQASEAANGVSGSSSSISRPRKLLHSDHNVLSTRRRGMSKIASLKNGSFSQSIDIESDLKRDRDRERDRERDRGRFTPDDGAHGLTRSCSVRASSRSGRSLSRGPQNSNANTPPVRAARGVIAGSPPVGCGRQLSRECVRNFESTSKGVINKGDSFRSTGSSPCGSNPLLETDGAVVDRVDTTVPPKALQVLGCVKPVFYVQLLGAPAVGKSSLCQQFLTSEYMGNIDPDDFDSSTLQLNCTGDSQKHVSVKLDGEESIIVFIDTPCADKQEVLGCIDAYVLVFAMDDRESYEYAKQLLIGLIVERHLDVPVIVVSNKSDLVRCCDVDTHEGRDLANRFECDFIETSASLNHRVDELLVNLIKIVRAKRSAKKMKKGGSIKKVTGFFKRLSFRGQSKN